MTAATDLVTAGFREGNLIPVGTVPTDAELAEGLAVLNRYLGSMYGYCIGENLYDWPVPTNQRVGTVASNPPLLPGSNAPLYVFDQAYPAANTRIVWDGSTQTVYMPETPNDGARMALVQASGAAAANSGLLTLDGNGRTIEGSFTFLSTTATSRKWLYRADLADWKALVALALGDDCPFPDEFDDFWITAIAIRLSPRYGRKVDVGTADTYRRMKSTIRAHYAQSAPGVSGGGILRPGYQSYETGYFDPF